MPTIGRFLLPATCAAVLATASCGEPGARNDAANAANATQQSVVPELPIPVPEPPLGRERLLVSAMRAASDFAAGIDDSERQKELAGKKFEFRIRFGCAAPGKDRSESPFSWSLRESTRTLKVSAAPTLSTQDSAVRTLAGEAFETVEGFWVRRPWLLASTCPAWVPAVPEATQPTAAAKPKQAQDQDTDGTGEPAEASKLVGIAQFFTVTGPRTMRRAGRPYEATKRVDSQDKPSGGFDLVLSGRLAALPDGRVIACTRAQGPGRPACIISVEFGKVSIERADTHEQLAQWGSG